MNKRDTNTPLLKTEYLTSVLNENEQLSFDFFKDQENYQDEFLKVVEYVAILNGIKPIIYNKKLTGDVDADFENICAHWDAPARKVELKGPWWTFLDVPLVGFYGQNKTPVVLQWKSGVYRCIFLATSSSLVITPENAKFIDPKAFQMYPSLPLNQTISLFDIFKFAYKFRSHELTPIYLVSIAISLLALFFPFAVQILFDQVISYNDINTLFQISLGLVVTSLSSAVFLFVQKFNISRFLFLAKYDTQISLWDRLLRFTVESFRIFSVGELFRRFYHIEAIQTLIAGGAIDILQTFLFTIIYFAIMFFYSPALAWIALFGIAAIFGVIYIALRYKLALHNENFTVQEKLTAKIIEFLRGVSQIRMTNSENTIFNTWAQRFGYSQHLKAKIGKINVLGFTTIDSISIFLSFLIFSAYILFVYNYSHSSMSLGYFLGFVSSLSLLTTSLTQLFFTVMTLIPVIPALNRADTLMKIPLEYRKKEFIDFELKGAIRFENISFAYPSSKEEILKNLSFEIQPGQFIGIMGKSGSGKSTLIRLLLGFEQPTNGNIFYDHFLLSGLDIHFLRKQLGVVLQNNTLFDGTILENLVTGHNVGMEEIENVLKTVMLDNFVKNLPMGVHTYVSFGSSTFSGGEIQRLCIARSLLNKPKILILDEATSALDNETQYLISEHLAQIGITRIVVAHRPSTLLKADRIYVLENGEFVAHGTFDDLKQKGFIKKIY